MIHFAATVLLEPLDPWEQWAVIHLGELLESGMVRFRQVLIIVARQNGKTHLCKVLALFWMFVERQPMIFGTSTDLEQAKEAWEAAVTLAQNTPVLAQRIPKGGVRIGNGQQVMASTDRSRYKIGAANRKGGRGKSIDRAIGDELREQHTWEAYAAAYNAMNLRPRAQVVYITNMGDARSVVLNSLRQDALDTMGEQRPVCLLEWSAPPGTHPTDPAGHAAANPQYGRRMDPDTIMSAARRVAKPGADPAELAQFLTETLCMTVDRLDPAIDGAAWARGKDVAAFAGEVRGRLAMCIDVSPDGNHAALAVAGVLADLRVRVEVVHAWEGADALEQVRRTLVAITAAVKPQEFGWFPKSAAAALDADLRDRRKVGRLGWPPRGVTVREIAAELAPVAMGFAEQVRSGQIVHSGQELLDAHVAHAEKLWGTGNVWTFTRKGAGHVTAVYAVAGAVHLARTMPARRKVSSRVRVAPGS